MPQGVRHLQSVMKSPSRGDPVVAQGMPRKKREPREEWERLADEKVLDSQAPSVSLPKRQPRQKAASVNTADDATPTVQPQRILPRELEEVHAIQEGPQHKLQEFEEFSPGLMCEGNSDAADLSTSRCEGYTEGLGKLSAGEIGEERSRSDVASEAFGHDSVREAYQELGPAGFYELKGASYVNPHENVLSEARLSAQLTEMTLHFLFSICKINQMIGYSKESGTGLWLNMICLTAKNHQ